MFRSRAEISGGFEVTARQGRTGRGDVSFTGTADGVRNSGEGTMRFRAVGRDALGIAIGARIEFRGVADTPGGPLEFDGRWVGLIGEASAEPSGNYTFGPSGGRLMGDASAEPSGA